MQSNYKKLGPFIKPINKRDTDESVTLLLGVSIQKKFIPSIANTIGTDMSTYKIIRRNQFAYGPVTSRNGDRISIALLEEYDEAIVSQAYTCFTVNDETELLPQYLMMWFRRPEFDRYARFMSHGSAREIFSWDELCNTKLPVPTIAKQREIVAEYHTIQNRITLNNQLIQNLEATAQAIYKQWFVEFEFPNEAGQPYKSSGGEMVDSELGEIPKGWEVEKLGQHIMSASKTHKFPKDKIIFFNTSDILNGEFLHKNYSEVVGLPGQAKKSIQLGDILYSEIRPENRRFALVRIPAEDYVVSTKLMVLRRKKTELSELRLYHYLTLDSFIDVLQKSASGKSGTFPQITFDEDVVNKDIVIADSRIEGKWEAFLSAFYQGLYARKDENVILKGLKNLLLSKLATIETSPSAPKPAAAAPAQLTLAFA